MADEVVVEAGMTIGECINKCQENTPFWVLVPANNLMNLQVGILGALLEMGFITEANAEEISKFNEFSQKLQQGEKKNG